MDTNQNDGGVGRKRGGQRLPWVYERAWAARELCASGRAASPLFAAFLLWLEEHADELDLFRSVTSALSRWEPVALSERTVLKPSERRATQLARTVRRLVDAQPDLDEVCAMNRAVRRASDDLRVPTLIVSAPCFVCDALVTPGNGRIPSIVTPISGRELLLDTATDDGRVVRSVAPRALLAACFEHIDQLASKMPDVRATAGRVASLPDTALVAEKCVEHGGGWGQPRHCKDVDGLGPAIEVRGVWPDMHGDVEAVAWLRHARADCVVAWLQIATEIVDDARAVGGVVLRTRSAPRPDDAPNKRLGFVMVRCTSARKRSAAA